MILILILCCGVPAGGCSALRIAGGRETWDVLFGVITPEPTPVLVGPLPCDNLPRSLAARRKICSSHERCARREPEETSLQPPWTWTCLMERQEQARSDIIGFGFHASDKVNPLGFVLPTRSPNRKATGCYSYTYPCTWL